MIILAVSIAFLNQILSLITIPLSIVALVFSFVAILDLRRQQLESEFRKVRSHLFENQSHLSEMVWNYYNNYYKHSTLEIKVPGLNGGNIKLVGKEEWLPRYPLPIDDIVTSWDEKADRLFIENEPQKPSNDPLIHVREKCLFTEIVKKTRYILPRERNLLKRYPRYSAAIADLDRPLLFEDRVPSYRLTRINASDGKVILDFSRGWYYDLVDTNFFLEYETAYFSKKTSSNIENKQDRVLKKLRFRKYIGDPTDFSKTNPVLAITVLTLFESGDEWRFIMHKRKGSAVAEAAGEYQVIPGMGFQPVTSVTWKRDFEKSDTFSGILKSVIREYAEEILGTPEVDFVDPDFIKVEPYKNIAKLFKEGLAKLYFLGIVQSPLSLQPEILAVSLFWKDSFIKCFKDMIQVDEEGTIIGINRKSLKGIPFTKENVEYFLEPNRTYLTGRATLTLAWKFREQLLGAAKART